MKKLVLLLPLLLSHVANADQIYTNRDGVQEVLTEGHLSIDSDNGLPVFPIIWDTEVDGKLPDGMIDQLGGLVRIDGTLTFDQAVKDADDAARQALLPTPDEKRVVEYLKIPDYEFREAIFEKLEGRAEKYDAYKAKIEAINVEIPK